MTATLTHLSRRRLLQLSAAASGLTLVASGTAAVRWTNDARRPRLTVLGSGERPSLLVTTGSARLLIAAGDDPIGFVNALAAARHPGLTRLDVLLVSADRRDEPVVARALLDLEPRHRAAIGRSSFLADQGFAPEAIITAARRYRLDEEFEVTVEVAPSDLASSEPRPAWRALVARGRTRVLFLPDAHSAAMPPALGPLSALILGGDDPATALAALDARAVIVGAEPVSGKDVRRTLPGVARERTWVVRVHPGTAAKLELVDGALRLPMSAIAVEPAVGDLQGVWRQARG